MFQPWSSRFLPASLHALATTILVIATLATLHFLSWRAAALAFTLLAVGLFAGKSQTFIYFQF